MHSETDTEACRPLLHSPGSLVVNRPRRECILDGSFLIHIHVIKYNPFDGSKERKYLISNSCLFGRTL